MAAGPTWAEVAQKQKTPAFLPTECAVNLEQFAAPQRLPPASSRHSTFIPLPIGYKQGWALDILSKLPSNTVGIVPRADIQLLEVCFATQEAQQDFLKTKFSCKHFDAYPVPPTGTTAQYVPIKLVNVPVLSVVVVEQQLRSLWGLYGEVVAVAPHTYKGTPLLSNCWDMVLRLSGVGSPLSATPFFDLLGFKVMASWPGSDKACPRCKVTGHDSQSCPKRPVAKKAKKRSSTPKQSPIKPATTQLASSSSAQPSSSTILSSAVPQFTADAASTDVEMAIAPPLPSPSTTTPPASTAPRMTAEDLLRLTPTQIRNLSPSVAPASVSTMVYMRLGPEQMDAMPTFIVVEEPAEPTDPLTSQFTGVKRPRTKGKGRQ
jgi:hypothetical protein